MAFSVHCRLCWLCPLALLALALFRAPAICQAAEASSDSASRTTGKVTKGPFRVEVKLDGALEPTQKSEISLHLEQWTELTVLSAVKHGAIVKQGEQLIACDLRKINEEIKDLENSLKLEELELAQSTAEIQALEKSSPVDLAEAERQKAVADADLKYFYETHREQTQRAAEFEVKAFGQMKENAEEELLQLEKMYKADDLTEGTEEIILKQQRFQVEMAHFLVDLSKTHRDRVVRIDLPREEESLRERATQSTLSLQKLKVDSPLKLGKLRVELAKTEITQARNREKLGKLRHDRQAMTIVAPMDCQAFYGPAEHGHWSKADGLVSELRPNGTIQNHQVLLTIVELPAKLRICATLPEKQLSFLAPGSEGSFSLTGYPDAAVPVKVESVSPLAGPDGKYIVIATQSRDFPSQVVCSPGMDGQLKLRCYFQAEALSAPAKAVFSDADDPDQHYVLLSKADDQPERRVVKIGRRGEKRVEILEGVAAGDELLLEPSDEE
jgi:multidrug efflux pump subunit AcrA (membrane-fusion protein)